MKQAGVFLERYYNVFYDDTCRDVIHEILKKSAEKNGNGFVFPDGSEIEFDEYYSCLIRYKV